MRGWIFGLVLLAGPALGQTGLEIDWRAMIGTLEERVDHRGCVCPDGATLVTFGNGAYSLIDNDGRLLAHRVRRPELAGALACACQDDGTIYLWSDPATTHVLRLAGSEPVPQRTFRMPGLPMRFVLVDDVLWVMGAATVRLPEPRPGYVRRFRTTGEFLDAPELPLPAVRGQSLVTVFGHGGLFYQPARRRVVYVPPNHFRFFCFDLTGRLVAVRDPQGTRHENADFAGIAPGPVLWSAVDWVHNAIALPDGRVAVQVIKGARPGGDVSFLEIYDEELNLIERDIPVPYNLGHLLGADRDGRLRFGNFRVMGASIVKVRLPPVDPRRVPPPATDRSDTE